MKKTILLYGPFLPTANLKGAYGGGTGGYTRNMSAYLNHFSSDQFQIVPCFHTIRGQLKWDNFIWRFLVDAWNYLRALRRERPAAIHVLAQYRTATPREFFVVAVASLLRIPILYELKAGVFQRWFGGTNSVFKFMTKYIIQNSTIILAEGKPYLPFLKDEFGRSATFFPNFVPDEEVPDQKKLVLQSPVINVLFVGYCYHGKGVFELVGGCQLAAQKGVNIKLSIIGHEHPDFTVWMEEQEDMEGLEIERYGRQPHQQVLAQFKQTDVYCYPTSHAGEGHNNTINEALMNGVIIITTKHGFLESALSPDFTYFLDGVSPAAISEVILRIKNAPQQAQQKAALGKQYLKDHYTSSQAFRVLTTKYANLLDA